MWAACPGAHIHSHSHEEICAYDEAIYSSTYQHVSVKLLTLMSCCKESGVLVVEEKLFDLGAVVHVGLRVRLWEVF